MLNQYKLNIGRYICLPAYLPYHGNDSLCGELKQDLLFSFGCKIIWNIESKIRFSNKREKTLPKAERARWLQPTARKEIECKQVSGNSTN